MGLSEDAPSLDMAYKLCDYAGEGRVKLSAGKPVLPGRKQVFRIVEDGRAVRDVIARADEQLDGRPLLQLVMSGGRRTDRGRTDLKGARRRTREELERFPDPVRALPPAKPAYPVCVSDRLSAYQAEIIRTIEARNA
jgi:nicotinate phosphoribosyltransferase